MKDNSGKESNTSKKIANPCTNVTLTNIETRAKIKLESGDTPETILRKETHFFDQAFDSIGQDKVPLSQLGFELKKIHPRYKPRRYGCKTLGTIYENWRNMSWFRLERRVLHMLL